MIQFLKDLLKSNDNAPETTISKAQFHQAEKPDPLDVPGFDAGIPTSG